MDVGKGMLVEVGRLQELAANYNQGKVRMLYTYIGMSINLAISVFNFCQAFCMYIEVNS